MVLTQFNLHYQKGCSTTEGRKRRNFAMPYSHRCKSKENMLLPSCLWLMYIYRLPIWAISKYNQADNDTEAICFQVFFLLLQHQQQIKKELPNEKDNPPAAVPASGHACSCTTNAKHKKRTDNIPAPMGRQTSGLFRRFHHRSSKQWIKKEVLEFLARTAKHHTIRIWKKWPTVERHSPTGRATATRARH